MSTRFTKAKVERTTDGGCRFDEVGFVDETGCIHKVSLIEAMGLVASVDSSGVVYDVDNPGESNACCWVDKEGRIYDKPYNSRTEPVAHVLRSGMVYRHPSRSENQYLAGRVEMEEGISLRQAAGAAAFLLLGYTTPAIPKEGPSGSPGGKPGSDGDDPPKPHATAAGGIIAGIIGIVGAAFLFNYIFGLLFDYKETVRQSVDTLTKIAYALNIVAVIASVYMFIKIYIHRNYDVPLKIFIGILFAAGVGSFFWTAFWIFIPSVLFNGDVPETFLTICGFICIALFMLASFMEGGNKNTKPRKQSKQQ